VAHPSKSDLIKVYLAKMIEDHRPEIESAFEAGCYRMSAMTIVLRFDKSGRPATGSFRADVEHDLKRGVHEHRREGPSKGPFDGSADGGVDKKS